MKSFKSAFSTNDEMYTPPCLVQGLLPFISNVIIEPHGSRITRIWCPFDNGKSEFVKILKGNNFDVIFGDLKTGKSFFSCKYPEFDISVSNPPFSLKLNVFKRLFSIGKPFAMLMNMMAVNYQEIGDIFYNQKIPPQFIIPDKKVSFNGKTSSFCSGYVTWKLNERTEYMHLDNNNTGKNFIPAENYITQ